MRRSIVFASTLVVASVGGFVGGGFVRPAWAQGGAFKPRFQVGEKLDYKNAEGKVFAVEVQRIDKKLAKYLIALANDRKVTQWVDEGVLGPTGSLGVAVDPAYLAAVGEMRRLGGEYDRFVDGAGAWGNAPWRKEAAERLEKVKAQIDVIAAQWPAADAAPMREGYARRKGELDAKVAAAVATEASQTAALEAGKTAGAELAAFYEDLYLVARSYPSVVEAAALEGRTDLVRLFRDFPVAEVKARIEADKARFPAFFKYYGSEEKGKYGALEYGGPKEPDYPSKPFEQLTKYHLKEIFRVLAALEGKDADLLGLAKAAIDRSRSPEEAEKSLLLVQALQKHRPDLAGLAEALAAAEAKKAALAAPPPKPVEPETVKAATPARVAYRSPLDLSKVDSGAVLTFSSSPNPGEGAAESFQLGDPLYVHAKFPGPTVNAMVDPVTDDVTFVVWIYRDSDGRELDYPSFTVRTKMLFDERSAGTPGHFAMPLVSDANLDCMVYGRNMFSSNTWEALSGLPDGEHVLEVRLDSTARRAEGIPLAAGKFKLNVTAAGRDKVKAESKAVEKAMLLRGGELVQLGLRVEGPNGFKLSVIDGNTIRAPGRVAMFRNQDLYWGNVHVGKTSADAYNPDGDSSVYVKRMEGGYEFTRAGRRVATITHDQVIHDASGGVWGKITNEWETITGPVDLLPLAAGLYHFSGLIR